MRRIVPLTVIAGIALAAPALAQHDHAAMAMPDRSPYPAIAGRDIKALSDSQVAQLRAGEGMGFALAAELNHYPGPKHALDMADSLGLTSAQRETIAGIRDRMNAEARRLGEVIIDRERTLDRAFAGGTITDDELRVATAEIARLQGELRYTHLRAHVAVRTALTADQARRYDRMRGYGASD